MSSDSETNESLSFVESSDGSKDSSEDWRVHRKKIHFPTWEIIGKLKFKTSNIGKSLGKSYRTNKIPVKFQQR